MYIYVHPVSRACRYSSEKNKSSNLSELADTGCPPPDTGGGMIPLVYSSVLCWNIGFESLKHCFVK